MKKDINIIDSLPAYIYWLDKENVYQGCNDLLAELFGLKSCQDIIGKTNNDLMLVQGNEISKNAIDTLNQNNLKALKTGKTLIIEETIVSKGSKRIVLSAKNPLYEKSKIIVGLICISIDISQYKTLESELGFDQFYTRVALENIIENLPSHIYWKDKSGVYLGCNDKQAKSLGFKHGDEIVGRMDEDLPWRKEDAEAFRKHDLEVIQTGQPKTIEENAVFDGKQATVLSQKIPLIDKQANIVGVLGISTNITQLKNIQMALTEQIEKTQQAYKAKTAFIATASHEIRTPMGNVIYSVDNSNDIAISLKKIIYDVIDVLNDAGKQEQVKQIKNLVKELFDQNERIKAEAYRALSALINLGDLHRLQTEGLQPKYETSNIRDLIQSAIDNSADPNKSKMDIHIAIDPKTPKEAVIDYNNIYEALRVVIGNAIRFSETDGIIKIMVNFSEEKAKKLLTITVQDFGVGISDTQLAHIFETLYIQDNNDTSNKYWKPSLQLPQAKMKVEISGGTLQIKSALKKGTTVCITVPYKEAFINKNHYSSSDDISANKNVVAILLVEDDMYAQSTIKGYLEGFKYKVDTASTSAESLEKISQKNYDIILMDITLPDGNGVETMQVIRNQLGKEPFFIAVTSHAADEDVDYFVSQGFVTVLTKPVNKLKLKSCIENVMSIKANAGN